MEHFYEAYLIGALLHDIGKFYQRATGFTKTHSKYSGDFINDYKDSFEQADLIKELVTHHHELLNHPEENPEDIKDDNIKNLAWLIDKSDNISSVERGDKDGSGKRTVLMDSIFNSVYIGEAFNSINKYKFNNLNQLTSEIEDVFSQDSNEEGPYIEYWHEFIDEFESLFSNKKVNLDSLYSLIQKYCWCIPSDTTTDTPDISLADHLKTTCAIAACAFQYHQATDWEENNVKNIEKDKYLLVAGDISGIQNYIYSIASLDTQGLSKRLRGRSFKIAALSEIISLDILRALDLPNMCKLMSAGGMFYLLVPNTDKSKEILTNKIIVLQDKLLSEFNGELSCSIAYTEMSDEGFTKESFGHKLQEVKDKLNQRKLQKFSNILAQGPKIFDMKYEGHGACSICDMQPGKKQISENKFICKYCDKEEELGGKLADNYKWENDELVSNGNWFVITNEKTDFKILDYYIDIVQSDKVNDYNPILAYNMTDYNILENCPCSFFPYAGYIPIWKNEEDYNNYKSKLPENDEEPNFDSDITPKSFSAIACSGEGHDLLGILRADVDNLGLIFSQGLGNNASISRISTLSSMLNLFFTRIVTDTIVKDYKNVYISYCGGDDLMLMGYFDDIIRLSNDIRLKLADFVCSNPNITISAGIGTYKAKTPVAITSRQTGDLLEESKGNSGKNSLTLFGTTLNWNLFNDLDYLKDTFYEELNNASSPFTTGFLYRLRVYQEMKEKFEKANNLEDSLYKARLSYDIARNFKDDNGEYKKSLNEGTIDFFDDMLNSDLYWDCIKLPITWAAYKNRK